MIRSLYLKDLAIISELNINFNPGLTVITGETGSGKSLLVKALSYVLGSKGNKVLVRTGRPHTVVETATSQGTIRRILSNSGRTKSFINDEPVKENKFSIVVPYCADFHGQHDQQMILNKVYHLSYLDRFADNIEEVDKLKETFKNITIAENELNQKRKNLSEMQSKKELLEFQLNEIESVSPEVDEDKSLLKQFKKLSNGETLYNSVQDIIGSIESGDFSILIKLEEIINTLAEIKSIDSELHTYIDELNSARISIQDVTNQLLQYQSSVEIDQEQCSEIDQRLQEIESLKRKYGGSIESVNMKLEEIKKELSSIETDGQSIVRLKKELLSLNESYQARADQLHSSRLGAAEKLQSSIERQMKLLNISKPQFVIKFGVNEQESSIVSFNNNAVKAYPSGYDKVEFYLSANPGESPKPLTDIASGGEISRIMLSIKTVFQSNDPVDTLIFDEIDSGISGETAEKVSRALVNLAKVKQVFCISHLPQIAARANHHLHISKKSINQKTQVGASYLNKEERINMISHLYGSIKMSGQMEESYRSIVSSAHG